MARSILLQIFVSKVQIILFSQLNKIVFPINKYFLNTFVKVFKPYLFNSDANKFLTRICEQR